jgi:filamentous hemagglutinin family protein
VAASLTPCIYSSIRNFYRVNLNPLISAPLPGEGLIHPVNQKLATVLCAAMLAWFPGQTALAQLIPDNTLGNENSVLNNGAILGGEVTDLIEGGASRGSNLFHSFLEFNIADGQRVFFANPLGIENILSRVTGDDLSNIFGTLGVDGPANLFFMNPNGILFGENGRLDINGSFTATTADAIQFGNNGFFSTLNPESPSPLLTVNPSAYLFNQVTGNITNQSSAPNPNGIPGLQVGDGESLVLLSPDIRFENSRVSNRGGSITLGGITSPGTLQLQAENIILPNNIPGANIAISGSIIDTADGGDVQLYANDLSLDNSRVLTGSFGANDAGEIKISASTLGLNNSSALITFNQMNATGTSGSIMISAEVLNLANQSQILAANFNAVNESKIEIRVSESLNLSSGAILGASSNGEAAGSDVNIEASQVNIQSGAFINNSALSSGRGGELTINATDSINLDEGRIFNATNSVGDAGNVNLNTNSLRLINGSVLNTFTQGDDAQGNAGNITVQAQDFIEVSGQSAFQGFPIQSSINSRSVLGSRGDGGSITLFTDLLLLSESGEIAADVIQAFGDAGDISIQANDSISVDGLVGPLNNAGAILSSAITSNVQTGAQGDGGTIAISTAQLDLINGAEIAARTFGIGNAGDITIEAEDIRLAGVNIGGVSSEISVGVNTGAIGNAGILNIDVNDLTLENGGSITLLTNGQGNAGDLFLEAENIQILSNSETRLGGIFSGVGSESLVGNGGTQTIRTRQLLVQNGTRISAITFGNGNAGNLLIEADRIRVTGTDDGIFFSEIIATVAEGGNGNGSLIDIQTNELIVDNGGGILTSTLGNGDAGSLTIQAQDIQILGTDETGLPSGLLTTVANTAVGNGGNLQINTDTLLVNGGAFISATTSGTGNAGNINITAENAFLEGASEQVGLPSGIFARSRENSQGFGGDINLTSNVLNVANGAVINAQTFTAFPSGDISIHVGNAEFVNGGQVVASTVDSGSAGNIVLNALETVRFSGNDVTFGSRQQRVLNTANLVSENFSNESPASGLFANTRDGSSGRGGRIIVNAPNLILEDRAQISSQSQGTGMAGPIILNASDLLLLIDSDISTVATQASGGDIAVNTAEAAERGLVVLLGDSDITTESFGDGGNITLLGAAVIAFDDSDIIARSQSGRGGNITLTNFFSETIPPDNQPPFDGDGQVDVNADGQIAAGTINSPDTSFVENSLNELSGELVDTAALTAGSCIARTMTMLEGSFVVTGGEGLPQRPGGDNIAVYPTGTVQTVAESISCRYPARASKCLSPGRWSPRPQPRVSILIAEMAQE